MGTGDSIRSVNLPPRVEAPFHIRRLESLQVSADRPELPHRHNFQEVIWIRSGTGRHAIDGVPYDLRAGTCYVIAKGQVHQFLEAQDVEGQVMRFTDELIADGDGRGEGGYLLALFNNLDAARGVSLEAAEMGEYEHLFALMAEEFGRPLESGRWEILGSLVRVTLVKLARALTRAHSPANGPGEPRSELFRAFILILEREFRSHHGVSHYAAALHVSPRRLSDAARALVGKTPKQIVEERLVLEARRMLQFTRRTTKEIAYELGFEDPSYFSKVFRRLARSAPLDYRRRLQAIDDD